MNKYKFFIPVAFILLHIFLHFRAGYVFPMPVGDEVAFYYPSKAVAERNELFAPELNSQRDLFWMPPGFMVTTGLVFKVTGASLAVSRHISLVFTIVAFVLLIAILSLRYRNIFVYLLAGLFFVSQHFLVVGNMARMEAMLLFLIFASFLLLYLHRYLFSLAVILLALLFHPNALYFLCFQLVYMAVQLRKQKHWLRPRWYEFALISFSLTCITWYGIYVLQHFSYFMEDWQFQLSTRNFETFSVLFFRVDQYAFLAGFLVLAGYSLHKKDQYFLFLLMIAFAFWLARLLGMGWTYGVYNIIAILLVAAVFLFLLQDKLEGYISQKKGRWLVQGLVLIIMVLVLAFAKTINLSTQSMLWQGCVFPDRKLPYVTAKDLSVVKKMVEDSLQAMGAQQPLKVYFIPAGDGVIFNELNPSWTHVLPIFDTLTKPDLYIYHESVYLTNYLKEDIEDLYLKFNLKKKIPAIYQRDSTESWHFFYPEKHQPLYQ